MINSSLNLPPAIPSSTALSDLTLSSILRNYLAAPNAEPRRWNRLLSPLPEEYEIETPPNASMILASHDFSPSYERLAARKLASVLVPPLTYHQHYFPGQRVEVRVVSPSNLASELLPSAPRGFPGLSFHIDLEKFQDTLKRTYSSLGAYLGQTTLCSILCGEAVHHMALVRGDLRTESWPEYGRWRERIKTTFGVDFRPIFESGWARRHVQSGWAIHSLTPRSVESEPRTIRVSESSHRSVLPVGWRSFAHDWRNRLFLSVDEPKTVGPEDILSATQQEDHSIKLTLCVPFHLAGTRDFQLGRETIAVGQEMILDSNGIPLATKVSLVATQSTASLSTTAVSALLYRKALERNTFHHPLSFTEFSKSGVEQLEQNPALAAQVLTLGEAAGRILQAKLRRGWPVRTELLTSNDPQGPPDPVRRGEMVVSEIINFGQEQLTRWVLHENGKIPILIMRPQIHFGRYYYELQKRLPEVTYADLVHPTARQALVSDLQQRGAREELQCLIAALQYARIGYRYQVITRPEQIKPGDMTRIKPAHKPIVGTVNMIQFASSFVGTTGFSVERLSAIAKLLNRPISEQRPHRNMLGKAIDLKFRTAQAEFRRMLSKHPG